MWISREFNQHDLFYSQCLSLSRVLRLLSLALCLGIFNAELSAEVTLTAANNISYQLMDTGRGTLSAPTVWENWPQLCLRVDCIGATCAPCETLDIYDADGQSSTIELEGRQRLLAPRSIHGLEVTRRVFVPSNGLDTSDGFVRFYDTIHNPGVTPASISVRLGTIQGQGRVGKLGSQVWHSSTYDTSVSTDDRWLLIDDQDVLAGDESIAILFTGAGGRLPNRLHYGVDLTETQGLYWDYDQITIAPHTSISLLTVVVTERARPDTLDEVRALARFKESDVAFGLSDDERARVLNADLNPFNAAPFADLNGPYTVLEGTPFQVTGIHSFDPEGFPLSYEWDFDHDGVFGEDGLESEGVNVRLNFDQNGEYPIALRVVDHQQKSDIDRVMVQVLNADPLITAVSSNTPIYEGQLLNVQVEASDPSPLDILSYAFDWEAFGAYEVAEGSQAAHLYPSDGTYTARVRVRDQDGGESDIPFTVVVLNAPPVIQQIILNGSRTEGSEVTFTVEATDPGNDPLLYEFDYNGDGVIDRTSSQATVSERFDQDGEYQVYVRVTDDQGASAESIYQLSILNVSPIIHGVTVSAHPQEGEVTTLSVIASDVGLYDQLTYEFDLDGIPGFEVSQTTAILEYIFPDNISLEVSVRVLDHTGGSTTSQFLIEVENQAPTGTLHFEGEGVQEGLIALVEQDVAFEGVVEASDPSLIDAESLSYFWDLDHDGVYELSTASARVPMRFLEEGIYVIRCLVRDKDDGALLLIREVSVIGRPPILQSFEILDDLPYQEGQLLRFKLNVSDPDPILYLFDFDGDGVFEIESDTPEIRYAFPDEGFYEVRARAQDSSGFVESVLTLQVANVAPSIEIDTGDIVGEGEDLVITVTARDPGLEDLVILTVNIQEQIQQIELMPDESRRFVLPTLDNGLISIIVNARDEDGAVAAEVTAMALVQNRPPFISSFSPLPAREGSRYQQVIPANDPAGLNDHLSFSLINPPLDAEIDELTGLLSWTPSYEDYLHSPILFQLVIEDEDGGRLEHELSIDVLAKDEDEDGIPDTYELQTCENFSPCLDPTNPEDASSDHDLDGRDAFDEWQIGSNPFVYEGPQVPRALHPIADEQVRSADVRLSVAYVESDRPLLLDEFGNLASRTVELQFEVYADEALNRLIANSGWQAQHATQEGEISTWLVTELLIEDQRYWWRVRAQDGPSISPWSVPEHFRLNIENLPPLAPQLSLPEHESIVSDFRPLLTFYPSSDPDGDRLYYMVRLYRDSLMGPVLDSENQVISIEDHSMDPLYFRPVTALEENTRYLWDVIAIDEDGLESPASEPWEFTVDLDNESPSDPVIHAPLPDSEVRSLRPIIQAGGSIDQEGADVRYHFEVRVYGASQALASSSEQGIVARGGLAEWIPNVDLQEDQKHVVSVYTSDGLSNSGLITSSFRVSAEDDAPSIPILIEPEDGALVPAQRAILLWGNSIDPEGGAVRYQVQFCDQRARCQESDLLSERRFDLEGLIPSNEVHLWRVTAFDEAGNTLGPSSTRRLVIKGRSTPQNGGCTSIQTGLHDLLWLMLIGMCSLLRRRSLLN